MCNNRPHVSKLNIVPHFTHNNQEIDKLNLKSNKIMIRVTNNTDASLNFELSKLKKSTLY